MDTNDVFDSLEAIDTMLDKEFGVATPETVEPEIVDNSNTEEENKISQEFEETQEGLDQPVEEEEQTPEPETEVEEPKKPEKSDKKDYAFANLRNENTNLKKERDTYKSDSDFLKTLAQSYGYDDTAKFQEALKQARYQKEAEARGYDYGLYKKTMEQEERIQQLEKEREQDLFNRNVERFKYALNDVVSKYGVDEEEVFSRLEDAGVTVDELLQINNPMILLNGVLSDKIQEKAKQSQITEIQNMKGLVEDKNEQNTQGSKVTIESLLKSDLAKYKADNFL